MANSFLGGLMQSIGPAIQQGQESALKKQMLDMQMQEYEARQKKADAEAKIAQQHDILTQQWQMAKTPEEKQQIMQQGALLGQDYKTLAALSAGPSKSMTQQMEEYDAYLAKKGGGQGQGQPGNVFGNQVDINPTFKSGGDYSIAMNTSRPSGKLAEVQALFQSTGADASNLDAQRAGFAAVMSPPGEVQSMMMQDFAAKFGGRGGQPQQQPMMQQPPQAQAGMELTSPTGARVMVDNPETLAEMQAQGWPMAQGEAVPQQQAPRGRGGSPYDVVRQKDVAAAIQQAGGTTAARTQNEIVSEGERNTLDSLQESVNLIDEMSKHPVTSATGVVQGSDLGRWIGERAPTGLGGNTDPQTAYYTKMEELKNVIALSRGGKTFTDTEQARLNAILPTSDMSDREVSARLAEIKKIFSSALDRQTGMITRPRSEIRRTGAGGAGEQQAGPQAGGVAPDGTVIRMKDGSSRVKQGGKWAPYGGK